MSNTSKNLVSFTVAMATMALIFWGLGYYIDQNFGGGTSILVGAVLVGVVIASTISMMTTMMNNRTHQSAGDDITSFAEAMSKTQMHAMRAQAELARADGAVRVVEAKAGLLTHKDELQRRQRIWRQADEDARRDAEAQRRQDQAAADAQQSRQWWTTDADAVDVELQ